MRLSSAVAVWVCCAAFIPALAAPVASDFEVDAEGWQVVDLIGVGSYGPGSELGTYPVTWHAAGGNPGAYIDAPDPTTNTYFFQAPAKFLGNQSAALGGTLDFSVETTHNNYSDDRVVVLIGNGGQTIVSQIAQPDVLNTWLSYSVPLTGAGFRYGSPFGSVVSDSDFANILGNLENLRIPAEFGTPVVETTGLDSVNLTPEPAALALLTLGLTLRRRRARGCRPF